jgi:hypothetical protein
MRRLSPQGLLRVWERGLDQRPVQRALELLSAVACPEESPEALASLSIGERDAMLLTLREATFGSEMAGVATCARCANPLELTFTAADLRAECGKTPGPELSLARAGYELRFRLPDSRDLAVTTETDVASGRRLLFDRCLLQASRSGTPIDSDELPDEIVEAAAQRMAETDPRADIQLAISCAVCSHQSRTTFDIVSYFWSEIEAWARRLFSEVHILASAYGWHERDILSLSPVRRQSYLEMVGV